MSNPTTPFSWQMPTATDLVTDLPADFEVFGQAVATSMADLLGGTTGQVLAKNSNTDMDFVWTTANPGDITGVTAGTGISGGGTSGTVTITNSMATEIAAKGDLIVGTGSATFDNLTAGSNGETLVADSSTSTGLRYQGNYAAGKNQVINGAFDVWQRGTTFTVTGTESVVYKADRWSVQADGSTTTRTISRQAFTPGTAPVAGYEGNFFLRYAQTTAGNNSYNFLTTRLENVTTFAGQTVTLSFWAKADAARTVSTNIVQNFGSGGSGSVGSTAQNNSLTTSWQRFTYTVILASISGKTIGTSSFVELTFQLPAGNITPTIDIWGVQLEAGSVATAFQTATGTLQGELSACMRYYWRRTGENNAQDWFSTFGTAYSTTNATVYFQCPQTMRVKPSAVDYANLMIFRVDNGAQIAVTSLAFNNNNPDMTELIAVGGAFLVNFAVVQIKGDGSGVPFIGFSAEL